MRQCVARNNSIFIYRRDICDMLGKYETLFEESNLISLRLAAVIDDGKVVSFRLLPADSGVMKPARAGWASNDFEWVSKDYAYLYRHVGPREREEEMMQSLERWQQHIRQMDSEAPIAFRLLWGDSGNTVALFLNGEPWAFIHEQTHQGYSKGVLNPRVGNPWNQELFERVMGSYLE